jgi:hypothetical protein
LGSGILLHLTFRSHKISWIKHSDQSIKKHWPVTILPAINDYSDMFLKILEFLQFHSSAAYSTLPLASLTFTVVWFHRNCLELAFYFLSQKM